MAGNGQPNKSLYTMNLFLNNIDANESNVNYINNYIQLCNILVAKNKKLSNTSVLKELNVIKSNIQTEGVDGDLINNLNVLNTINISSENGQMLKKEAYAVLNAVQIMLKVVQQLSNNNDKYFCIFNYLDLKDDSAFKRYGHCKRVLDNFYPLLNQLRKYNSYKLFTPTLRNQYSAH